MEYIKYQVFAPDPFYDEFIEKVLAAGIHFKEGVHEAGRHQVFQTTANMGIRLVSYMVVVSAPLNEFDKLNAILEQMATSDFEALQLKYGTTNLTPEQLKRDFYKLYEKDKVHFYTIKHQLALLGHPLPEMEEIRLVDEYGIQYGMKSISLTPALILAGLFVVLLAFNRVIGVLPALALCAYAWKRKYEQQEMPDGRMEYLYDEPSRQKAGVLLAVAFILLGITGIMMLMRLYHFMQN
jgi:hypothetical protein